MNIEDQGVNEEVSAEEEHLPIETIESLKEHMIELEKQVQDNWDRAVRASSELDNVRKRAAKDMENAHKFGIEDFVQALLPIIDALEQAVQSIDPKCNASIYAGLDLTLKMFEDVLAKYHVSKIYPIEQPFDPSKHEAMTVKEIQDVEPNMVLSVYQKGYMIYDRVIRPARVVVSKAISV